MLEKGGLRAYRWLGPPWSVRVQIAGWFSRKCGEEKKAARANALAAATALALEAEDDDDDDDDTPEDGDD